MSRISRPSPAMVVAITALVLGASGTTYAATKLPAKSVGTPQLKNNAVTAPKLKNNSVTAPKLNNGAVTADKLAGGAVTADKLPAGSVTADKLDPQAVGVAGLTYQTANFAIPARMGATMHVECPAGLKPISGGVKVSDPPTMGLVASFPQGGGWTGDADNFSDAEKSATVFAVCAQSGSPNSAPAKAVAAKPNATFYRVTR